MSGSISGIPSGILVPLFYLRFDNSQAGTSQPIQRALIIGQPTSASVKTLTYVSSVSGAATQWGGGSELVQAIAAYRRNDQLTQLYALPYADAGGATAATGTITFTGPATANGTINLYVAGLLVTTAVVSGQSATTIASNVSAAINAFVDASSGAPLPLPVTASPSVGVVTVTGRNGGTLANGIPIVLNYRGSLGNEYTPAGVTVTITGMAGGATDPTVTDLDTVIGDQEFDFIIHPWGNTTALASSTALMNDSTGRFAYNRQLWGHVFSGKRDTVTNLGTLGGALNDQHTTVWGVNANSPTPDYIWSSATTAALISGGGGQSSLVGDSVGIPGQTVQVQGVLPAPVGQRLSFNNENTLLSSGIALTRTNAADQVRILRAVTTYQTNALGARDNSYLDVEEMFLNIAVVRELRSMVTQRYARVRLVDDGTRLGSGIPAVSPRTIAADIIGEYAVMEAKGWVENTAGFAAGLVVARNTSDNSRVDVLFDPNLTSGLRVFAVNNQFRLAAAA